MKVVLCITVLLGRCIPASEGSGCRLNFHPLKILPYVHLPQSGLIGCSESQHAMLIVEGSGLGRHVWRE